MGQRRTRRRSGRQAAPPADRAVVHGDRRCATLPQASTARPFRAWAGYAFERLCFKHADRIVERLGLTSIGVTTSSSFRYAPRKAKGRGKAGPAQGTQIDLLLDRDDGTITVCEMTYTDKPFVIDRKCARELGEKLSVFEAATKTKKAIQLVLVSAAGLKRNHYSEDMVADTIDLDAFLT